MDAYARAQTNPLWTGSAGRWSAHDIYLDKVRRQVGARCDSAARMQRAAGAVGPQGGREPYNVARLVVLTWSRRRRRQVPRGSEGGVGGVQGIGGAPGAGGQVLVCLRAAGGAKCSAVMAP